MSDLIGKDEIAQAISDADALAEEHQDLPAYWRKRGVDIDGLTYVAMQRGLRAVMFHRGENPNLQQAQIIQLSPEETLEQIRYATIWMDGFAAARALKDV